MTSVEPSPDWDEWGRITRFLEGARLALAHEVELWGSLQAPRDRLSVSTGKGKYRVRLDDHLEAMRDEETLFASVLIHSYAFAESAAAERLSADQRAIGGIEKWGERLLKAKKQDWKDVKGELAGAVEVAITRNAFAHGTRRLDAAAEKRAAAVGMKSLKSGDPVTLSYETLKEYRARLRSLLNGGGT